MRWLVVGGCSLALSVACRGDDWIIAGELPRGVDEPGTGPEAPEFVIDPDACPTAAEAFEQRRQAYGIPSVAPEDVGRWAGTLGDTAAAGFPGRTVTLQVDADGTGTLTLGEPSGETFAEQGQPDNGYLCDAGAMGVVCGSTSGFVGGFPYPIEGARSRGGVVSFTVVIGDPWGLWCAQQEPVSWEDSRQMCGVSFGVRPPAELSWSSLGCSRQTEDGAEEIDCALMYALEFCACARDACFASSARSVEVGFQRTLDGASLSGSLWYENEIDAASIVLRRVP